MKFISKRLFEGRKGRFRVGLGRNEPRHTSMVRCLAVNACYVASGSDDRTVRLWRRAVGAQVHARYCLCGLTCAVCMRLPMNFTEKSSVGRCFKALERLLKHFIPCCCPGRRVREDLRLPYGLRHGLSFPSALSSRSGPWRCATSFEGSCPPARIAWWSCGTWTPWNSCAGGDERVRS